MKVIKDEEKGSLEVTQKVRKEWNRYCKRTGRIMNFYTPYVLTKIMNGEVVFLLKKKDDFAQK